MSDTSLTEQVRARYAAVAASPLSGAQPGVRPLAEAFGYTPEQLAAVPDEAHTGLSCGNPTATAHLRPGEVVVNAVKFGLGGDAGQRRVARHDVNGYAAGVQVSALKN